MRKGFLVALQVIFLLTCKAQDNSESGSYMEPMPFTIERKGTYVKLPDSLGGESAYGFSIVNLQLDGNGDLQDFEITKLVLKYKEGNDEIDYLNTESRIKLREDYPYDVFRYYDFLKDYLNQLKVVRNPKVEPKKSNKLSLIVRF